MEVMALLDTACTKTLVHPRCVARIPYLTASDKEIYFPAAHIVLEVEGKTTTIPVGVSENMNEDMLMGRDSHHFRRYPKKVQDTEPGVEEVDTQPASAPTESGMVVTSSQQLQQDSLSLEGGGGTPTTRTRQAHHVYSLLGRRCKAEGTETETTLPEPDNLGETGGNKESDEATTLTESSLTRS